MMLYVQVLLAISIVLWAYIVTKFIRQAYSQKEIDPTNSTIFLVPVFAIVFILTVLRSVDTGVDHATYLEISNKLQGTPIYDIWNITYAYMEPLLLLLLKLCSQLGQGLVPFLAFTTATVLGVYYIEYRRDSKIVWLSVLLLICFGSYFIIFNAVAQIFVSILVFAGSRYLYKGDFTRYLLIILLASLFHKTALFMLPMYFLLRYRPASAIVRQRVLAVLTVGVVMALVFFDQLLKFATVVFFPEYNAWLDKFPDVSNLVILRPLLILVFVLLSMKYVDLNNMKERVWFNAVILIFIISIFSIKFGPMQRFTYFLLPYITLLIPGIIAKIPTVKNRNIYALATASIAILYVITTNIMSPASYSFLWQVG